MKPIGKKRGTITLFKAIKPEDATYMNLDHPNSSNFHDGRIISYPPGQLPKFPSNTVKTSKYSILTWAPKSLIWQFQRISNIYFLIMSILSGMYFSPKSPFSMAGTFAAVLFFTMLKEGYEDYYRHKQDSAVNSVICHKLHRDLRILIDIQTKDLKVGDLVQVKENEYFPADLLLISSSDPKGKAYVNTVNLDGENNLKEKNSVQETKEFRSLSELGNLKVFIECDQPNALFEWNCNFMLGESEKTPLSLKNLLLKGCILKNTEYVYGVVVYTGHDTKIIQNSKKPPNKVSNVLRKMNKILYSVFVFQIGICLLFSGLSMNLMSNLEKHSYLKIKNTNKITGFIIQTLTFWVAYSHLIPISLYVALEVLKLFLSFLINEDKDLYHNGNPAKCKSSDLIEELGQVEFIFSDKTGTLTSNEMVFRKCMVNNIVYGKVNSDFGLEGSQEHRVVRDMKEKEHDNLVGFCRFMALCNSVFPAQEGDKVKYQASSPDELALVNSSSALNVHLLDKIDNITYLKVNNFTEKWEVLIEVPFNSDRKRMSVIVRHPDTHKLTLLTKGADSVMIPLLKPSNLPMLNHALSTFSIEGLRSLVMAQRVLSGSEYHEWHERWKKAMLSNDSHKDQILDSLAGELEHDLDLVGCSGIEDKLQEGVPECIELLMKASIRLWVLTGDKEETAIEIAKSCNLIKKTMDLILLSSNSSEEIKGKLLKYNEDFMLNRGFSELEADKNANFTQMGIVVNGSTLVWIMADETLKKIFFKLGFLAASCVCCRVTPAQKSEVVKLAKNYGKWITLSIGDGANDVSMIQEAHIGIGISGKEGTQAAQSADFVLHQFRFLSKFLLVHGRWGYRRVSYFICYYFYKNIAVVFTELWFALFNGFSGQIFFLDWLPLLYNSFWTSWPCLIAFALEQDIGPEKSLELPSLYKQGQKGKHFTFQQFWKWVIFGVWHGSLAFWVCILTNFTPISPEGDIKSLFSVSTIAFSIVINTITLKLYLENLHWTWISL